MFVKQQREISRLAAFPNLSGTEQSPRASCSQAQRLVSCSLVMNMHQGLLGVLLASTVTLSFNALRGCFNQRAHFACQLISLCCLLFYLQIFWQFLGFILSHAPVTFSCLLLAVLKAESVVSPALSWGGIGFTLHRALLCFVPHSKTLIKPGGGTREGHLLK